MKSLVPNVSSHFRANEHFLEISIFRAKISNFRANALGVAMNRLQKYSRIIILVYQDTFLYGFRDDLRKKLKFVPPYYSLTHAYTIIHDIYALALI